MLTSITVSLRLLDFRKISLNILFIMKEKYPIYILDFCSGKQILY